MSAQIDCDERQREAVPIEVGGDEEKKLPLTLEPPTKKENVSFTQKELKKWKRRGGGGGRNSNRPSVGCEQIQRRRLRRGKDGPARTFRLISRLFNL